MKIVVDDLTHSKVLELLQSHLDGMRNNSPSESVHALNLSELRIPEVTFFTAWEGNDVLGCGAIKELSPEHAEIKSMRTHTSHLRKGVAAALLEHIMHIAKQRGYSKVSLETGYGPSFEPALQLYKKYGFRTGDAFADYKASDFNQFFHFEL